MRTNKIRSDEFGSTETRCEEVQSIVTNFVRGERSVTREHQDAMSHVAGCYECERFLADSRKLHTTLGTIASTDRNLGAPASVELRLLATFRNGSDSSLAQRFPKWLGPLAGGSLRITAIAAAAALVIAAAILAIEIAGKNGNNQKTPTAQTAVVPSTSKSPAGKSTPDPGDVANGTDNHGTPATQDGRNGAERETEKEPQTVARSLSRPYRIPPRNSRSVRNDMDAPAEITTDFISVGPPGYWQPMDGGVIVRVELPRSTLASYGLPVAPERGNGFVKADVVVGEDGFPRAVRFVR